MMHLTHRLVPLLTKPGCSNRYCISKCCPNSFLDPKIELESRVLDKKQAVMKGLDVAKDITIDLDKEQCSHSPLTSDEISKF